MGCGAAKPHKTAAGDDSANAQGDPAAAAAAADTGKKQERQDTGGGFQTTKGKRATDNDDAANQPPADDMIVEEFSGEIGDELSAGEAGIPCDNDGAPLPPPSVQVDSPPEGATPPPAQKTPSPEPADSNSLPPAPICGFADPDEPNGSPSPVSQKTPTAANASASSTAKVANPLSQQALGSPEPQPGWDPSSFGEGFTPYQDGVYKGMLGADGKPHGYGICHMPCGDTYRGEYSNGEMHGWGHYTYSNGDVYIGQWADGHSEGLGKYIFRGFAVYVGHFKMGQVDGFGVMTLQNTADGVYTGWWSAGLREGEGHSITNNSHYEGQWRDGKEDGHGLSLDKRSAFFGNWANGSRHGKGFADHLLKEGVTRRYLTTYNAGVRNLVTPADSEEGLTLLRDPEWESLHRLASDRLRDVRALSFPTAELQAQGDKVQQSYRDEEAAAQRRIPPESHLHSGRLPDQVEEFDEDSSVGAAPLPRRKSLEPLARGSLGSQREMEELYRNLSELKAQNERLKQENSVLQGRRKQGARSRGSIVMAEKWHTTAAKLKSEKMQHTLAEAREQTELRTKKIKDLEMQMSLLTSSENAFIRPDDCNLQEFLSSGELESSGIQKALELRQKLEIAEAQASAFEDDDEATEELGTVRGALGTTVTDLEGQIEAEKNQISSLQAHMTEMAAAHEKELQEEREELMRQIEERSNEAKRVREQLEHVKERESKEIRERETERSELREAQERLATQVEEIEAQKRSMQASFLQEKAEARRLRNELEDMKGQIRVYVRTRPLNKVEVQENGKTACLSFEDETTVTVIPPSEKFEKRVYSYNRAFSEKDDQEAVFEDTCNLISSAVDGYNVCVFAYGQTGSGKTFTLTGSPTNPGVAPRAVREIFKVCGQCSRGPSTISCYMVELYNEQVLDLLRSDTESDPRAPALVIKKDKKGLVHVQGAIEKEAADPDSLYAIFEDGVSRRRVRATRMNEASSRSHLIFSVKICVTNSVDNSQTLGKFTICDLAGSERLSKTQVSDKEGLAEAKAINSSLTVLGNVIAALAKKEKHVPYRESKLTQIMSDSLGGNAKTLMFVNISPSFYNYEETISSLNYANRVKMIVNTASKTVETDEIRRLRAKIKQLQSGKPVEADDEFEDI